MALITPTPPTIGQPNSTEDPDVLAYLVALKNLVNGGLDNANIAALAAIAGSKIADASITAAKLSLGAAGSTKIAEVVLTSTGTMTFSAIPSGYRALRVVGQVRSAQAAAEHGLKLIFNGSAAALYSHSAVTNGVQAAASGQTSAYVGQCAAGTANAAAYSSVNIVIPNYASGTMWKAGTALTSGSGTGMTLASVGIEWQSTNAITSMTFNDDVAFGLAAGSILVLHGIA